MINNDYGNNQTKGSKMSVRKSLGLNPTSFYMQVDGGSVATGAQWESDYQTVLALSDEDEIATWQEPNLWEVEKDENGNWIEKN